MLGVAAQDREAQRTEIVGWLGALWVWVTGSFLAKTPYQMVLHVILLCNVALMG